MHIFQSVYQDAMWSQALPQDSGAQWLLVFGDRQLIASNEVQTQLAAHFPYAQLVGCTTSGEVIGERLYDNSLCLTAVTFESATVSAASLSVTEQPDVVALAKALVEQLPAAGLRHVYVICDGSLVNGTQLVDGFNAALPSGVTLSGGLAGDDDRFEQTVVWHNQRIEPGLVAAIGIYGDSINIGHGHLGGWKPFGSERVITKSEQNILFELDGQPALETYKTYLGGFANELPASALRFPLGLRDEDSGEVIVRTILSIDEAQQTMTFAGDMPQGQVCRLMRANYDDLIDGASDAAQSALTTLDGKNAELAIVVSCVGRRLVLNQRVEEELEQVQQLLSENCRCTGFYSYGELSPLVDQGRCGLYNQTMTITVLNEG